MGVSRIAVFLAAAVVAGAVTVDARGAPVFRFEPAAAEPGDIVTVRVRETLGQRPIRLYLVPDRLASRVHSRFSERAHFIGTLRRGSLRFTVPPLDSGRYALGVWQRTFSVVRPPRLLRLTAPPAKPCPVTLPNSNRPPGASPSPDWHGNGLLWTSLPRHGVLAIPPTRVDADGLFDKIGWLVADITLARMLTVRGERLDGPAPPMKLLGVNGPGQSSSPTRFRGASMATPVVFPTEGCWKITGRVQDVSLSFVLKVVTSPTG
jgi:hypothetical protein